MQSIKVNTSDLLEVLQTNREKHLADYKEAVAEYRKLAVAELTEMLKQAKSKDGKIKRGITAPEPQSFVSSYDTAIKMLEMSVDDTMELSQAEFLQYVEDKWSWQQTFASTTMVYKKA